MSRSDAELWNERYAREERATSREPVAFLRDRVDELGSGRALVLAMGRGRNAVFLAAHGFDVTGVDVSERAVAGARRLADECGVNIEAVVADLDDWDPGRERWEVITNFYYLDRALLQRIVAALVPGGWFIMETFSSDHPTVADFGPTNPEYLLGPGELLGLVDGLRIVHYEDRLVAETRPGGEGRIAGLVRLLARKPLD